jgi:LysR family transcriptional regulator, low CO2-responsive transcriptional regulator
MRCAPPKVGRLRVLAVDYLPSVTLYQLKVFVSVSRLGSFQRAAESLSISAPSVSGHVKNLERTLRLKLFERGSGRRSVLLTEAGKILLSTCDEAFGAFDVGFAQLETLREGGREVIRLGVGSSFFGYFLAPSHGAFRRAYPDVDLQVSVALRPTILNGVRDGTLDLGVVSWAPEDPEIQAVPFLWFDLVLVGPPGHPLSSGPTHAFGALRGERFVLPIAQSAGRRALNELASQNGMQIQDVMQLGDADAVLQAVSHGYGITVMPYPSAVRHVAADQLSLLRVSGFPVRQVWHLVHGHRRLPQKVNKVKTFLLNWQWSSFTRTQAVESAFGE